MRENLLPLLEDHGVDLVLCGRSHSYVRSFLIDGHYGLSTTETTKLPDTGVGLLLNQRHGVLDKERVAVEDRRDRHIRRQAQRVVAVVEADVIAAVGLGPSDVSRTSRPDEA